MEKWREERWITEGGKEEREGIMGDRGRWVRWQEKKGGKERERGKDEIEEDEDE